MLEARMVGKVSASAPQPQPTWSSVANDFTESVVSSDSDDDNGGEFVIQAYTQKRQKLEENDISTVFERVEAVADTRQNIAEITDGKAGSEVNRKKTKPW